MSTIIRRFVLLFFLGFVYETSQAFGRNAERSFVINYKENCFMKDSKPFRYISGSMHYFRIPSVYWRDRLMKAKALGLNTIQTYVAWNFHEMHNGVYDFSGDKDLLKFIEIAEELDLLVILRPGPYIDAEWEAGGIPWWVGTQEMRTSYPPFMDRVTEWFDKLFPMLESKIYKNGGPIIAFQVENEYGSYYACDKNYLQQLKGIYDRHFGKNAVVLFTVDSYTDDEIQCGTIPELYKTVDFGSDVSPQLAFKQQRKYQPSGPLVNSEYYTGWLDYWGFPHQTRKAEIIAEQLDILLSLNASVNLYLVHGGTNFGYMNGVDFNPEPLILFTSPTSYDYDAPISEAGDTTYKYFKIREVLKKYVEIPPGPVPQNTSKAYSNIVPTYPFVNVSGFIDRLYDGIKPVKAKTPLSMEELGQGYGFVLYRTTIPTAYQNISTNLSIDKVSDRSIFIVDGILSIIQESGGRVEIPNITLGKKLEILVENQGRAADAIKGVHYLPQFKGIFGNVKITPQEIILSNWTMYSINDTIMEPMHRETLKENMTVLEQSITAKNENKSYIIQYFGLVNISYRQDSYIRMDDFDKGIVYINGINLGKFWQSQGPQKTLFVPKSCIIIGLNAIEIINLSDLEYKIRNVKFVQDPILG